MGRGAVVLFQTNDRRAWKILFELEDVADFRAAPAIDRLVVVADAADVLVISRQQAQPQILRDVRILILVDEDIAEPLLIALQDIRMLLKYADCVQQQVAKIAGVQRNQPRLIFGVHLSPHAAIGVGVRGGHPIRRDGAVLPAIDHGGELAGGPALVVDIVGLNDLLHQAQLVVTVQNREAGFQIDQFRVPAQDLDAERVEGAEPGHPFDGPADQIADPVFHLARGLVGEGHGEDFVRAGGPRGQKVRDPAGQRLRFAGTGARQHQDRAVQRCHSLLLGRVQPVQIWRRGLRARHLGKAGAVIVAIKGVVGEIRIAHAAHPISGRRIGEDMFS